MRALPRWLAPLVALAVLTIPGTPASARNSEPEAKKLKVAFMLEHVGCRELSIVCTAFTQAAKRAGVTGRIVVPSVREDPADTLQLLATQGNDLIVVFGVGIHGLAKAAARHPGERFAVLDAALREVPGGAPTNAVGVVFRTSEAAYVAGWVAGRLERARRGSDTVGIVGGVPITAVEDFVIGFRAGAKRASPGVRVLTDYSFDFVDQVKCRAIARRHVAKGAGVLFNVAGRCGDGTMEVAKERGVWAFGVDFDQSSFGRHVATSVLKRFDLGLETVFRRLKSGKLPYGRDLVLTLRERAVGLSMVSPRVPKAVRAGALSLERKIAKGDLRVPGAYEDPR